MGIDFTKKGVCKECRHWKVYDEKPQVGICSALGALLWPDGDELEISITYQTTPGPSPLSDIRALRTTYNFGCNSYYPHEDVDIKQ